MVNIKCAPIGAWKCSFPALLGNCNRPTDQPTNQPTNRLTWNFMGNLHNNIFPISVCGDLTTHSFVTFVFTAMGLGVTSLFPFVMAEAFIRHGVYALCPCNVHLPLKHRLVLAVLTPLFYLCFNPVATPQIQNCSLASFSAASIIFTLIVLNVASIREFMLAAYLICAWMNVMLYKVRRLISAGQPTYAEIESALREYDSLRFAADHFVFFMFTSAQGVAIMAFYIATHGKSHYLQFKTKIVSVQKVIYSALLVILKLLFGV